MLHVMATNWFYQIKVKVNNKLLAPHSSLSISHSHTHTRTHIHIRSLPLSFSIRLIRKSTNKRYDALSVHVVENTSFHRDVLLLELKFYVSHKKQKLNVKVWSKCLAYKGRGFDALSLYFQERLGHCQGHGLIVFSSCYLQTLLAFNTNCIK